MIDAFLSGISTVAPHDLDVSRLGLRLDESGREGLAERLQDLLEGFAARAPTPDATPWSLFVAVHPDPDRD